VVAIGIAVEQSVRDHFETELEIAVDPTARRHAGAGGPDEAFVAQCLFEYVLPRGRQVEVAGHDGAVGI